MAPAQTLYLAMADSQWKKCQLLRTKTLNLGIHKLKYPKSELLGCTYKQDEMIKSIEFVSAITYEDLVRVPTRVCARHMLTLRRLLRHLLLLT